MSWDLPYVVALFLFVHSTEVHFSSVLILPLLSEQVNSAEDFPTIWEQIRCPEPFLEDGHLSALLSLWEGKRQLHDQIQRSNTSPTVTTPRTWHTRCPQATTIQALNMFALPYFDLEYETLKKKCHSNKHLNKKWLHL